MDSDDEGAFWFRKRVSIADISSDYKFIVDGGIDDMDIVYVNGQKIGSTICWNCPREYTIPKSILIEGENTIAIRVINIDGPGGFMGQMTLLSNSGERISIEGEWRYQYIARLSSLRGDQKFYLYHLNSKALAMKPAYISNMNEIFSISSPQNTPGVLFNGMINPLIPYGIKGAIWYQGESNVGRANQYEKIFPSMIDDWRERWNSNFPFYFVQIAPFSYSGAQNELSPALRDAQRKSLVLSNTGMAVTMDIGDSLSIHPGNKQDVGDRLARLALGNDYDVDIVTSGPLYKKNTIYKNKIILEFDLFGSELVTGNSGLSGFEIAGLDMVYIPATAKIVKDKIEVFSPDIKKPKFVRYAWRDYIAGTLFNKEGLPASSFTTKN
jgi:sialate O-acetylesterase